MLCQFTFENFKSYKNETVLDLQAVSKYGFEDSLLVGDKNKLYLPLAAIYGPNAGGKSNVLKALVFALNLVVVPIRFFEKSNSNYEIAPNNNNVPFMFDNISRNSPTKFELFFMPNKKCMYKYGISLQDNQICKEYLYRKANKPNSKTVTIFEREQDDVKLGASIRSNSINTSVNDQIPYLAFLAINYSIDCIKEATGWFRNALFLNYAQPITERTLVLQNNEKFKTSFLNNLNNLGIKISDFVIKKGADKNTYNILCTHTINDHSYNLNLLEESDGTQKIFKILPLVMAALERGSLLIVDELDSKLHPQLLEYIVKLFKNPLINTRGAQLIYSTHDVTNMNSSTFRTDEIWFACRLEDESSDLYSLWELRDEHGNRIKQNSSYSKQYLEGRYGADPFFNGMMDWR